MFDLFIDMTHMYVLRSSSSVITRSFAFFQQKKKVLDEITVSKRSLLIMYKFSHKFYRLKMSISLIMFIKNVCLVCLDSFVDMAILY